MSLHSSTERRALRALQRRRNFSPPAFRVLLRTKEMIHLAKGLILGEWRDSEDRVVREFAMESAAEMKARELREALEIVRERFSAVSPRERKRYSPEARFRIVVFIRTWGYSLAEAAELFLVDSNTIARWQSEATEDPTAETIGTLVRASPPLRSYGDVTKQLVLMLEEMRIGGSRTIAAMLVRAGKKISHETVRRYRKRARVPPLRKTLPANEPRAVTATAPNQIWMTDVTEIPSLLRIWAFKLVVVLDVYSRFPLAFGVFRSEPSSAQIASLVESAATRYGALATSSPIRDRSSKAQRFAMRFNASTCSIASARSASTARSPSSNASGER